MEVYLMNLFINSPITSLNVYDVKSPKGKLTRVNGREFYSITYRKKGTVKLNYAGKTLISNPGCITFTPKKTDYTTEIKVDTHMIAIHFDYPCKDESIEPFVYKNSNHKICSLFDEIYEKYSAEDTDNYECYSLFYNLLSELKKHFITNVNKGIIPYVVKAKLLIENNFRNSNFNIDCLVSKLPVSAQYLRREFKSAYGVSPIKYLNYVRLKNAISLLSAGYYSIEELSRKCGYSSVSYFIQSFKKSTGYSPTEYKRIYITK
jgi:AraC-like DNA-binding protein